MSAGALYVTLLGAPDHTVAVPGDGSIALGRGRGCALRVDDPMVSRRHAVVHGGAPPMFEELGGKNASVLLRAPRLETLAPGQRIALASGDVVKLGGHLLLFHHADAPLGALAADPAAFEAALAAACRAPRDHGEVLAVVRIQVVQAPRADVGRAARYTLIAGARHVVHALLDERTLTLALRAAPAAIEREADHLAAQLGELGLDGELGLALCPRDGDTPAALVAAASAEVDTVRAFSLVTPVVGATAVAGAAPGWPAPLTALVGRDAELAELAAQLAGARLVTICGPPGIGKSRLALHHAAGARTAVRCELAGDVDPELALAAALGCAADHAAIARALAARGDALIVLDDCEQVTAAVFDAVSRALAAAPRARFVVTSRELVGVPGEHALELRPLAVPAGADDLDAPASRLFAERARVVDPAFAPDARAAALVRALDGHPLAIELAAGCLDVFGLAELVARLPAELEHLADRRRGVPIRQRSLRDAFDTWWATTSIDDRAALAACATLGERFAIDDVARALGATATEVARTLAGLRRRSWLRVHAAADGSDRREFALSPLVRAYLAGRAVAPAADHAALAIEPSARAVVLPSGARVDLSRHAALRRIVLALAHRHRERGAAGLSTEDLLASGWPGERVDPFAGSARVRVALSRLRGLGLRDVLVRGDDGYAFAPELVVELAAEPRRE